MNAFQKFIERSPSKTKRKLGKRKSTILMAEAATAPVKTNTSVGKKKILESNNSDP